MKAIILAAGMGTRLKPLTDKIPKALIEIAGKTLLERSLDSLNENGIKKVIIVIGFYGEVIKKRFGNKYKNIKITYIENKEYEKTGSMYSFSQTKGLIDEDVILLESDLLYDPSAIKTVLDSNFKDLILVANILNSNDDVYICTNDKQEITNLGKDIPDEDKKQATGALVGISKFSKEFLEKLFERAEQHYKENKLNYHYEKSILETSKLGHPINVEIQRELCWIEIDNENDLKRAKEEIYPKIKNETN